MSNAAAAGSTGWAWVAMAVSVLLLAGLSAGAYLLLFRDGRRPAPPPTAERRLAGQLARGQITEQEHRHLIAALDAAGPGRRPGTPTSTARSSRLDQAGGGGRRRGRDREGPGPPAPRRASSDAPMTRQAVEGGASRRR